MASKANPAIVAVAFNRPLSISRLLDSLTKADYQATSVPLVISVDFSDSDNGEQVRKIAESFVWPFGEKELIFHDRNLGLRKHILSCGDLTEKYGSVIVFEDDLSVSPCFHNYASAALDFTADQSNVAGVSLYHYRTHFLKRLPFIPLYDGHENYYLQNPSSVGQAWSREQWNGFRSWYDTKLKVDASLNEKLPDNLPIHPRVANWPESSWLKFFIWYMVEQQKYFLFPRVSYSTNHHDVGTHALGATCLLYTSDAADE